MDAAELYAEGMRKWPEVRLTRERFAALTDTSADEHGRIDAGELVLAAGCAAGDAAALEIFERHYVAPMRAVAALLLRGSDADIDDVLQQARCALLVPADAQEGPAIPLMRYAGRGRLRGLVRTVVQRACTKARKRREVATPDDEIDALTAVVDAALRTDADPELDRGTTKRAVAEAWSRLGESDRLLLQLHHIKGLSVRRLATIYGVHSATAARRVANARLEFATELRSALREVDPKRAEAVRPGFESRLSLSFMRATSGVGG